MSTQTLPFFSHSHPALRGVGWMLAASLSFAMMASFAKLYSAQLPLADLLFFRNIPGALIIWIWALRTRKSCRSSQWLAQGTCSTLGSCAALCYFFGVTHLPLSTAISLNYTMPVFLTLLMWATLHARQRSWVLGMMALSMIGVLSILQPELRVQNQAALGFALLSGALDAMIYQRMHKLSEQGEPAWRNSLYHSTFTASYALLFLLLYEHRWPHVAPEGIIGVIGLAGFGLLGRLCVTHAFERGNPTIVGTFSYATVLFSALVDVLLFQKPINNLGMFGMTLLVGAGMALTIALRKVAPDLTHTAE